MKVIVLTTQMPFVRTHADMLAEKLQTAITAHGHDAEIVRFPFESVSAEVLPRQILACRLFKIHASAPDLVIALQFPVCYIPFVHKKVWLLESALVLPSTPEGHRIREIIRNADRLYLREATAVYASSKIMAEQLKKDASLDVDGVFPLSDTEASESAWNAVIERLLA